MLARQIVNRNQDFIGQEIESKVEVSFVEKEKSVIAAYVVDAEGRILAPARQLNQYITDSKQAAFMALTRKYFSEKENQTKLWKDYGSMVAAAIPFIKSIQPPVKMWS